MPCYSDVNNMIISCPGIVVHSPFLGAYGDNWAIVVFTSIQMRPLFNPEDGGPGVKYALVVRIAKAYDDQTQIVMPQ
jgi:hypothetical protein